MVKGDASVLPPTALSKGLIYGHKEQEKARQEADTARGAKDGEVRAFLADARTALLPILGRAPSPEWALAGYAEPGSGSNAVPRSQDARLATLAALAMYLATHPPTRCPAARRARR